MPEGTVLDIPEMLGVGDSTTRTRQKARKWPKGTVVISADSHWLEGDIWVDRFPARLRDRAPRMIWEDEGCKTYVDGKLVWPPVDKAAALICAGLECVPGMTNVAARLDDLDYEGVEKELLFPQRTIGVYMSTDVDLREHFFRAHNEAVAEFCAPAPDRLFFVAVPNYWDPSATAESIQEVKRLGARALLVPRNPRKDKDGEPIVWQGEKMGPFWKAVEDSGLPLCFHIGEKTEFTHAGATGIGFLINTQGFRGTWGELVFGGVFDRHPALKVVFVEAGLNWVPGMLHDADLCYNSFAPMISPQLAHAPSWYWSRHCYATFMTDPAGLRLLDMVGPETAMWSSDYPHQESTLGYTNSAIAAVFEATSVKDAQKIIGRTALGLFNMR